MVVRPLGVIGFEAPDVAGTIVGGRFPGTTAEQTADHGAGRSIQFGDGATGEGPACGAGRADPSAIA